MINFLKPWNLLESHYFSNIGAWKKNDDLPGINFRKFQEKCQSSAHVVSYLDDREIRNLTTEIVELLKDVQLNDETDDKISKELRPVVKQSIRICILLTRQFRDIAAQTKNADDKDQWLKLRDLVILMDADDDLPPGMKSCHYR